MWLFVPEGFLSIVRKPGDEEDGTLTIRARTRADLVRFLQAHAGGGETPATWLMRSIRHTPKQDYPYRVRMDATDFGQALTHVATTMMYPNFKAEVERVQGKPRHDLYTRVWGAMLSVEAEDELEADVRAPQRRRSRARQKGLR